MLHFDLLQEYRDKLDAVADRLLEVETIGRDEFLEILGESPLEGSQPPAETPTPPEPGSQPTYPDAESDHNDLPNIGELLLHRHKLF